MTRRSAAALLALATAGCVLAPLRAGAHGIETSLERFGRLRGSMDLSSAGGGLKLQTHFSNGEPVSDAVVRLVPPDGGTPLEVGRTDDAGRLSFSLPATARADWEVQIDAGSGHRDYLELREAGAAPGARQAHGLPLHPAALAAAWAPLAGLSLLGCWNAGQRWRRRRPF